MKRTLAVIVVLLGALPIAEAQQPDKFSQFEARVFREGESSLKYRLLVPKSYKPGTPWPLIVWLHGSGEKGANNSAQLRALENTFLADAANSPAFVMAPQCPDDSSWLAVGLNKIPPITEPSRLVVAAVADLCKEFDLDDRRIYLGGFSMGSCGTWEILSRYPDLFAAAFPIAGPPGERKALAPVIKNVPTWVFHGDLDNMAPVEMSRTIVAALQESGAEVKYTEYRGVGHECRRMLLEPELPKWLLAHRRTSAPNFTMSEVPESAALYLKCLPHGQQGTWVGVPIKTRRGGARFLYDKVYYRISPAADADPAVEAQIDKMATGEIAGKCRVTGTVELEEFARLRVTKVEQAE